MKLGQLQDRRAWRALPPPTAFLPASPRPCPLIRTTGPMRTRRVGGRRNCSPNAYVGLHLLVEAVMDDERVRHAHPVRLHRVALAIVVVAHVGCGGRGPPPARRTRSRRRVSRSSHRPVPTPHSTRGVTADPTAPSNPRGSACLARRAGPERSHPRAHARAPGRAPYGRSGSKRAPWTPSRKNGRTTAEQRQKPAEEPVTST